jgi:hypothetical protein
MTTDQLALAVLALGLLVSILMVVSGYRWFIEEVEPMMEHPPNVKEALDWANKQDV